ncbi:hypothetical protein TCSYLVIO_008037 [Trypanosoma cruzi]|nr:hypothetical protein TCSYLVIO_008037 [Trypanosoma cruzi]
MEWFPFLSTTHSSPNSLGGKSFSFMLVLRVSHSSGMSLTPLLMVHCGHTSPPTTCRAAASEPSPEMPPLHPCGEASHSHRPTAASRRRWLQRTLAAVSSRCPNGVGRGARTARWSVRHAAALQRLSVKQSRPTASAATQRATGRNNVTQSPFFILFYSRCLSVCPIADTEKKCTPSQKKERKRDPTVPPRANTLLHPPPLPRRGPQSHRSVSTTMCITPSCSEQWAGRGHASPRSIFPPLKCCVPAQNSKHNQSAHKPNHPPHSLKHIIRME